MLTFKIHYLISYGNDFRIAQLKDARMAKFDFQLLADELRSKGISDERVLDAIAQVPRDEFVREDMTPYASEDSALPIDCEQTISQPFVVARMTEIVLKRKKAPKKILEIGTGSGYQAAILSKVVDEVYSVERIEQLHNQAKVKFETLSMNNIHTLYGDGHLGWPEYAPYDAILVTAGSNEIPSALLDQLAIDGIMVIPIGDSRHQFLVAITRTKEGFTEEMLDPVIFVPMLPGTR